MPKKQPSIKSRKPPTPKPPATNKTAKGDNPKRHCASANQDSVVISKIALDERNDQRQHYHQLNKHIELDHSDIPGLSSIKSPSEPPIIETAVHTSGVYICPPYSMFVPP